MANGFRLVEGRRVAAFTNDEEVAAGKDKVIPFFLADRLEEQGATHVSADVFEEKVVVDERLVTGQNPASAAGVAKEMEKLLAEVIHQEKAEPSMTRPRRCVPRMTPKRPQKRPPKHTRSTEGLAGQRSCSGRFPVRLDRSCHLLHVQRDLPTSPEHGFTSGTAAYSLVRVENWIRIRSSSLRGITAVTIPPPGNSAPTP